VPLGVAGLPYLITASVLGAGVLAQAFAGRNRQVQKWARGVFVASIVYLPVLFAVMVLDGRA
jgi:heme O synthase-like polyprenyltransferase